MSKQEPSPLPEPTPEQAKRVALARQRVADRGPRLAASFVSEKSGTLSIGPNHSDEDGWIAHLKDACGTTSQKFAAYLLSEVECALRPRGEAEKLSTRRMPVAMAALDGIAPEDEAEAMLAAQMIGTYALAAEMLGKARHVGTSEGLTHYIGLANKLMRTYTMQLEALARLRRGGEQIVRHVHVNAGGQAIVGPVNYAPGGGGNLENPRQPLAPRLEYGPGAAMWSENPEGDAVPGAGGAGEETVSDARRRGRKRRSARQP